MTTYGHAQRLRPVDTADIELRLSASSAPPSPSPPPSSLLQDWFIPFCRKQKIEPSVVAASLRLRDADPIAATGDDVDPSKKMTRKQRLQAARKELVVCLRVMIKFIDDNVRYSASRKSYMKTLTEKAGFKQWEIDSDGWSRLEMDLCRKVDWNLRQYV